METLAEDNAVDETEDHTTAIRLRVDSGVESDCSDVGTNGSCSGGIITNGSLRLFKIRQKPNIPSRKIRIKMGKAPRVVPFFSREILFNAYAVQEELMSVETDSCYSTESTVAQSGDVQDQCIARWTEPSTMLILSKQELFNMYTVQTERTTTRCIDNATLLGKELKSRTLKMSEFEELKLTSKKPFYKRLIRSYSLPKWRC